MGTVRYTVIDGEVIAEKRNGVRSLYVPDPLGSTVALLDNTQAPTDTFSYWPYGENDGRTGTSPTPFQFVGTAGYYRDSGSRNYVRARTLDNQKVRWLAIDPMGYRGGDLNLMRYVQNNPASVRDPSGTIGFPPACIAAGACIGIAGIAALACCLNDPRGFGACVMCWCAKNPIACGAVVAVCGVLSLACLPELAPWLVRLRPILVGGGLALGGAPAFATGGSSGASQCDERKNDPCVTAWIACTAFCDGSGGELNRLIEGPRWTICCHKYCHDMLDRCQRGCGPIIADRCGGMNPIPF